MFRTLSDRVRVSPQITPADVAMAATIGVTAIINNRPDDEEPGQISGATIAEAARAAGLTYTAIPVTHAGFSQPQLTAMAGALAEAKGGVLAYCRSGTRSTLLWALAEAARGADPALLAQQAQGAGYDLAPISAMLDMLAASRQP